MTENKINDTVQETENKNNMRKKGNLRIHIRTEECIKVYSERQKAEKKNSHTI